MKRHNISNMKFFSENFFSLSHFGLRDVLFCAKVADDDWRRVAHVFVHWTIKYSIIININILFIQFNVFVHQTRSQTTDRRRNANSFRSGVTKRDGFRTQERDCVCVWSRSLDADWTHRRLAFVVDDRSVCCSCPTWPAPSQTPPLAEPRLGGAVFFAAADADDVARVNHFLAQWKWTPANQRFYDELVFNPLKDHSIQKTASLSYWPEFSFTWQYCIIIKKYSFFFFF